MTSHSGCVIPPVSDPYTSSVEMTTTACGLVTLASSSVFSMTAVLFIMNGTGSAIDRSTWELAGRGDDVIQAGAGDPRRRLRAERGGQVMGDDRHPFPPVFPAVQDLGDPVGLAPVPE